MGEGTLALHFIDLEMWLQVWLQEFAWTEAEKLRRLKERSSNLRLTSSVREEVDREPMFCFETAIKLYYFSHIIYFYDKVRVEIIEPSCVSEHFFHGVHLHA